MTSPSPASGPASSHDLAVVGGTPAGIACAVRAAREGLSVLLTNPHGHLGGILSSGLAVWDTLWEGRRSPLYDEVREAVFSHYRERYGADSPQYRDALPSDTGHLVGRFEARVAEKILTDLVAREKNIAVLLGHVPVAAARDGSRLTSVTLRPVAGGADRTVKAGTFADCTYEGDLAALARVPCRVGREARGEYGEPHAGVLFMRPLSHPPGPEDAATKTLHDRLRLRHFSTWQVPMPQSTGAADGAVQACNYRTTLTTDPANRVPVPKPAHYDPYYYRSLEIFAGIERVPNDKYGWNRPQLVGRQTAFVEASWEERRRILDEHWDATMGLLYFLQHDATVPGPVRQAWLEYGLPKDEFADNGHRPHEMYVREARRIEGRAVFTQHDAMLVPGLTRAPVHADSIAMTEWYLDSHSCTTARMPGGLEEGKMMLHQETFPGQVPYRCLLPRGLDNLLVPVCLSATHVGWNVVRLEPVFVQTGEAAGLAAALAREAGVPVAGLDADRLVRELCRRGSRVAFLNDMDDDGAVPSWLPAAQYFATRGFFADYEVRPHAPLTRATAEAWARAWAALRCGEPISASLDRDLLAAASDVREITGGEMAGLLSLDPSGLDSAASVSRGAALRWMFDLWEGRADTAPPPAG